MIKLENQGSLPQARAVLSIQSLGDAPAISLLSESIRTKVGDNWVDDVSHVRQRILTFVGGDAFELGGKVPLADAVECAGAHKVVVEVEVETQLTQAYGKGDRSKEIAVVALVRVVEVWGSATKRLWSADGTPSTNGSVASKTLDLASGRITTGART